MKQGVLIVNLGTPDSYSVADVRTYLKQFLMDAYVIDKPFWFRFLLVHGIIAPFRSRTSAALYQKIWTDEGSPLLVYSQQFCDQLQNALPAETFVALGMRYGNPSVQSALDELYQKNIEHLIIIPMYPHYAQSSTQTAIDEVLAHHNKAIPFSIIPPFYKDASFIENLSQSIQPYWQTQKFDHLLLSYHGLPERHLTKLNKECAACLTNPTCDRMDIETCYRSHAYQTSRLLQQKLGMDPADVTTSFQSRLGRDPWIEPSTAASVLTLAKNHKKRLLVACPSFVTDCLETMEEINIAARQSFINAGGTSFELVACLNDSQPWVHTVEKWVRAALR